MDAFPSCLFKDKCCGVGIVGKQLRLLITVLITAKKGKGFNC